MNHVVTSSAWTDVISSLTAAGVDRTLAVGIVDILVDASQPDCPTDPEIHHTRLLLSKTQRVNAHKASSKDWDDIDQILPRLFLTTEELLAEPALTRKYKAHQYCKHAALTGGETGKS